MSYKVNVALKLTPRQVQQALDRTEEGMRLLLRLRGHNVGSEFPAHFTPTELALLLDFLPDDALDLNAPEMNTEIALVKDDAE